MGLVSGPADWLDSFFAGRTWTKIRRFSDHAVGGMINYDRVSHTIIVQHPSRVNISAPTGENWLLPDSRFTPLKLVVSIFLSFRFGKLDQLKNSHCVSNRGDPCWKRRSDYEPGRWRDMD